MYACSASCNLKEASWPHIVVPVVSKMQPKSSAFVFLLAVGGGGGGGGRGGRYATHGVK